MCFYFKKLKLIFILLFKDGQVPTGKFNSGLTVDNLMYAAQLRQIKLGVQVRFI